MFLSKNNINSKDWMDVVFANRNKEYGAYQLRQFSGKATNIALAIVLFTVGGLSSLSFMEANEDSSFVNLYNKDYKSVDVIIDFDELDIVEPAGKNELKQETSVQVLKEISGIDLVKFTEINPSSRASHEDLASIDEAMDKKVLLASISMKGEAGGTLIPKGTFGKKRQDGGSIGVNSGDPTGGSAEKDLFEVVEVMPEPPGGMKAFVQWVSKNYKFSESALHNQTTGLVQVTFVVEKDGSLSSFDVKKDIGFGTGEEAIRLLLKAKKWNPGIQNGIPVRVAYTLPIRLSTTLE